MSTKTRLWCTENYFELKKVIIFFRNGAPYNWNNLKTGIETQTKAPKQRNESTDSKIMEKRNKTNRSTGSKRNNKKLTPNQTNKKDDVV